MVPLSFRVPEQVAEALRERLEELEQLEDPDITNRTDALQDALVLWLIMEGK